MTWKGPLKVKLLEINVDLIVADFFSIPVTYLADELGIPNIINFPGPLDFL